MIFNAFERMMALRYLRARRKESVVSVIAGFSLVGICLGVATLVIVMSVMSGFRHQLLERILGLNGHVVVSAEGAIQDFADVVSRLQEIPGIIAVHPGIEGQVLVSGMGHAGGAVVRGLIPRDLASRPTLSQSLVAGSLDPFTTENVIMIGEKMARAYGVTIGDTLTLISPQGDATHPGLVPRMAAYSVAAIFKVGMYEYDSGFIYMPLKTAQAYFGLGDDITHIDLLVQNPEALIPVLAQVQQRLGDGFTVVDWTRLNASFFNALQVERVVMFLILTLIILVAAFNIVSSLTMLVKDKGCDIAILRTMGAGRWAIMRVFFLAGASVGVLGTSLGLILGLLFCKNIESIRVLLWMLNQAGFFSAETRFLSQMPVQVNVGEVIVVGLIALVLAVSATLYPSWRASRLDPVEALRYE